VSALRVERDGPVLRITLARPDVRNAFDAALIRELAEAFVDVGRARAVVLAGEGRSFSAGADVDWMRSSVDLSFDENVADANALRRMLEAIDGCPAPVVARVQGHALGGGAGLVAASDIAIASRDALFAFSEVKLGIIPAVISPLPWRRSEPAPHAATSSPASASTQRPLCASASCTRSLTISARLSTASSASCCRPGLRPRVGRSDSSASGPTGPRRRVGSPSAAQATKARRVCAHSSRSARRNGGPGEGTLAYASVPE